RAVLGPATGRGADAAAARPVRRDYRAGHAVQPAIPGVAYVVTLKPLPFPAVGPVERLAALYRSQPDLAREAARRSDEPARILVVEDNFLIALQAETALAEAGFHVIGVAASAEEATELAAAHQPDLVVMDIRLSGTRDGIDVAIELYRDHAIRCLFA